MRLWHKDLISVLPRQQLLAQWRECCCIAKNIMENGTPNHILVNKIMDYPLVHFYNYGFCVWDEMDRRGYHAEWEKFEKYFSESHRELRPKYTIFNNIDNIWHNDRYLRQCYYNLQEKYDCGGITEEEWRRIENSVNIEAAQK